LIIERVSDDLAEGLCRRYQRVRLAAGDASVGEKLAVVVGSANRAGFLEAARA
jgi:hypothetical protein